MKKNVMMRLASFLLVCVLATTCGISGTFAKYVTKAEATDSARVAKWGVTLTGMGNAFAEAYDAGATVKTVVSSAYGDDSNTEYVVAPGTSGTLAKFVVGGEPEVSYELTFEVDEEAAKLVFLKFDSNRKGILLLPETQEGYVNPEGYYPIIGTLKIGVSGQSGNEEEKSGPLLELVSQIERLAFRYDVTTNKYSYTLDKTAQTPEWKELDGLPVIEVTWRWAFEYEDNSNYPYYGRLTAEKIDEYDTMLGNLAAGRNIYYVDMMVNGGTQTVLFIEDMHYCTEISYTLTATATQID